MQGGELNGKACYLSTRGEQWNLAEDSQLCVARFCEFELLLGKANFGAELRHLRQICARCFVIGGLGESSSA